MLMIVDEDISKDDIIGKLVIKKDGKGELYWSGLYNIKKKMNNVLKYFSDEKIPFIRVANINPDQTTQTGI